MSWLLPHWVLIWMVLAALIALVFRRKRLAFGLGLLPFFQWLIMPSLQTYSASLAAGVMGIVYAVAGLVLLQKLLSLVFGKEVSDWVLSQMIAKALGFVSLVVGSMFRKPW